MTTTYATKKRTRRSSIIVRLKKAPHVCTINQNNRDAITPREREAKQKKDQPPAIAQAADARREKRRRERGAESNHGSCWARQEKRKEKKNDTHGKTTKPKKRRSTRARLSRPFFCSFALLCPPPSSNQLFYVLPIRPGVLFPLTIRTDRCSPVPVFFVIHFNKFVSCFNDHTLVVGQFGWVGHW